MAGLEFDTDMGGAHGQFPITRRSAVRAARSPDPAERRRALDAIVASYWKPAYKYIRLKWNAGNDEAKDLTQGFFVDAMERELFARYESDRASFRTWLRLCLDGYVANERRDAARLKRGGGRRPLSLDFDLADREFIRHPPAADVDDADYFDREWIRGVFAHAVDALRDVADASGRTVRFEIFRRYDLDADASPTGRPSYEHLGRELGISTTQVTNHLAWARREFRRLVLERLRELTDSDAEFNDEARRLLGDFQS